MITKDEMQALPHSTETNRVERVTSTGDMDKFQETICASAMKTLGYVNMFNRGVGQVQTDLKENGNQPAEFNVNLITAFKVEVKVSQSYTNENGGKTGGKVGGDVPSLSQEEQGTTQKDGTVNGTVNAQNLSAALGISLRTIKRDLYVLRDMNLIQYVGSDKTGHWEVINQQR